MIRGTKRELDKKPSVVNVDLNVSIHNRFDIEVVDAKTGEVKQRVQAFNVVCDNLWNTLLNMQAATNFPSWSSYLVFGTGSGTPSSSDVCLFKHIGGKSVSTVGTTNYDRKAGILSTTKSAQILETEFVGETITEVGLSTSNSATTGLCTHAMLQDMNGNQISILKTDTDIINLYSTVFVHMNPAKKDGIQMLPVLISSDGTWEHNHVASMLSGDGFSTQYSGKTRFFTTPNVYTSSDIIVDAPTMTGDPVAKTWTFNTIRLPAASGNVGGLYGVGFSLQNYASYTYYYTPFVALFAGEGSWFPGNDVVGEAVGTGDGTTTEFALKFPHASNAKIYVDGVEATNVTVRNCPKSNDTAQVFQVIDAQSTVDAIIPFVSTNLRAMDLSSNKPGSTLLNTPNDAYFYNPCYETGIERFNIYYLPHLEIIEFSDDLINWEPMELSGTETNVDYYVPENLKHKKFLHIKTTGSSLFSFNENGIYFPSDMPMKAVLFSTPPAAGAIITADYHTPVIAKDENHVFDVSVTIHCGEYNPNA